MLLGQVGLEDRMVDFSGHLINGVYLHRIISKTEKAVTDDGLSRFEPLATGAAA